MVKASEAVDLGADVGLGVEPRPGYSGGLGDDLEGDGSAGCVELAQRPDGLASVSSWRRRAAVVRWIVLSTLIVPALVAAAVVVFEGADDPVEIAEHLPVHLRQPLLSAALGSGDDRNDLLAVPSSTSTTADQRLQITVLSQHLRPWGWQSFGTPCEECRKTCCKPGVSDKSPHTVFRTAGA